MSELTSVEHKVANTAASVITGLEVSIILSTIFWVIWNKIMPGLVQLRQITWLEAVGIFFMAKILFRDKLIADSSSPPHECEYGEEPEEEKKDDDKT